MIEPSLNKTIKHMKHGKPMWKASGMVGKTPVYAYGATKSLAQEKWTTRVNALITRMVAHKMMR